MNAPIEQVDGKAESIQSCSFIEQIGARKREAIRRRLMKMETSDPSILIPYLEAGPTGLYGKEYGTKALERASDSDIGRRVLKLRGAVATLVTVVALGGTVGGSMFLGSNNNSAQQSQLPK